MPSSVRLSPTKILTTIRREKGPDYRIDAWLTEDNGQSWKFFHKPSESTRGWVGNPPSTIMLKDGRLALLMAIDPSHTVSARVFAATAAGHGSGNRPSLQAAAYYFNNYKDQGDCFSATIWDPGMAP